MRNLIVFLMLFVGLSNINAQYDIIMGAVYNPNTISVGQSSTLEVTLINFTPTGLTIPANGLYVHFYWGTGYSGNTLPMGNAASFFTWTNDGNAGWYGTNHTAIPFPFTGNIYAAVTGTGVNGLGSNTSYTAQMLVGSDLNQNNNNGSTILVVQPLLPIELMSFDSKSNECGKVEITWTTASEENNDYMELLRSTDGKEYISLTKVKGTNTKSITEYSFVDTQNLINGETYYYRLRQVDFDGRSEMLKVSSVTMRCANEALSMDIYPNPVLQKLNVEFSGATALGKTQILITNTAGELVRTFTVLTTEINEVDLTGLTSGVYQLRTTDLSETLTKRFVKID
jgi:hypothetical protein